MTELPATWASAKFSDFGTWIGGGTPSKANPRFWNGPIPWVSPKDMKTKVIRKAIDGITEEAVENSAAKLVPAGSVLIVTRSGILAHTLPIAVTAVESTLNQDLKALALPDGIGSEYIAWGMRAFEQRILDKCRKGGTTVHSIEMPRLASFELPIAPTNEQRRIVEKIEAMFDEIDKGVESLQTARTTLGLYRQSLLKSAFEGRLTADWRALNADKLEDPKTLLARIQSERDTRYKAALDTWQDALTQWRAGGEKGKKPAKPKRPDDVAPLEERELKELPSVPGAWAFSRLGLYINWIEAGKSFKCLETEPRSDQVGVAKVSAVTWGEYNEHESKTCLDEDKINEEWFIRTGDFLLSRANTIELVGASVIAKKVTKRIMLSDKTLRIHFATEDRRFFLYYLRSPYGRAEIEARSTGNQESMRNIGQDRIKSIIIPVCGEPEQAEIVRILGEKLEAAAALEAEIDAALTRARALRQSILKKAFSGHLVPQDPEDEPASALLERIKADRARAPRKPRRKAPA